MSSVPVGCRPGGAAQAQRWVWLWFPCEANSTISRDCTRRKSRRLFPYWWLLHCWWDGSCWTHRSPQQCPPAPITPLCSLGPEGMLKDTASHVSLSSELEGGSASQARGWCHALRAAGLWTAQVLSPPPPRALSLQHTPSCSHLESTTISSSTQTRLEQLYFWYQSAGFLYKNKKKKNIWKIFLLLAFFF